MIRLKVHSGVRPYNRILYRLILRFDQGQHLPHAHISIRHAKLVSRPEELDGFQLFGRGFAQHELTHDRNALSDLFRKREGILRRMCIV
jgi:hypothetical protein